MNLLLGLVLAARSAPSSNFSTHRDVIPTLRNDYYAAMENVAVPDCEVRCLANTSCVGFTYPEVSVPDAVNGRCWLYGPIESLQASPGYGWHQRPGLPPVPVVPPVPPGPGPPAPCAGPDCFTFTVDWASGSNSSTLPTGRAIGQNFSVRKLEAVVWPGDGKTYAYVDIVPYASFYYPASYSTEVGVFSSPDGRTGWQYHGIVIPRGKAGGWDGGGIASPGAAVGHDGSVIVGYAAENSPAGGINRGIGVAISSHPLGPFTKQTTPIASPTTICGGKGRCDDVIMQSRPDGVHIYHSVKGGCTAPGCGIRHRVSSDNGKTWSNSTLVLSATLQPGHEPAESIAGRWFPEMCGGKGGMVIITDGCAGAGCLHAYISKTSGDMVNFVAATQPSLSAAEHPPFGPAGSFTKGNWASDAGQIGFIPDANDNIVGVSYSVWNGDRIREKREYHGRFAMSGGYTHTVYALNITTPPPPPPPPPALSTATVLALNAVSRAGSRNTNLKHLLFYTCVTPQIGNQCEEGFSLDQAGIATSAVSSNFSTIEAGVAHNISILFAVHDTFFINGKGLRPDWQMAWAALETKLVPLIKARIVVGFFIGDELFPGKISFADFTTCLAALATIKAQFPWLVTWENEGGTNWVDDFKKDGVPADLDIVSLDDYYMGAGPIAEVTGHRKFYEDEIYPLLKPHQKVFLVPGSFATHDPNNTRGKGYPQGNKSYCFDGTFAGCDEYMAQQAAAFAQWAEEDPRVAGFAPWHWDSRPIGVTTPYKEVGVVDMPKTKAVWQSIGQVIRKGSAE